MTDEVLVERVTEAMLVALKDQCTVRGECYAHGFEPCSQEGGQIGEVDGEFDLEVLARAAIEEIRKAQSEDPGIPVFGMKV